MLALIRVAPVATQHIHRRRAAHAGRHLSESQHSDLPIIGATAECLRRHLIGQHDCLSYSSADRRQFKSPRRDKR
jgi:hypothetical protein